MLQNYFKIAWRTLRRNKVISLINFSGLALGLATCLVILLFIRHELNYDRFNEKAGRIVRVIFGGKVQGELMNEASVMPPVAAAFKADFPEVEEATRLREYGAPRIQQGAEIIRNHSFAYVDANFFSVFTLPFVDGDPATALREPYTVVLSQTTARLLFKDQNPVGKIVQFKDLNPGYKVTGVMNDIPHNSHFQFDMLASMASLPEASTPSWMQSNFYTYLVLRQGADYKALEARLPQVVDKYIGPQIQAAMGITLAQFRERGNDLGFRLQPLTDIYLHSDFAGDLSGHGDVRYVWIFGAIAGFMLLIACINFMNLSTAGASKRAREVGVRKVVGSGRSELVGQFLLESVLMSAAAMLAAVLLAWAALPFLTPLTGFPLSLAPSDAVRLIPALFLFTLLTGISAGSYPAFFLSAFSPGAVLKSRAAASGRSGSLRSGLVVFQFFLSAALIICTAVVFQQLKYIRDAELGYDKEAVLILPHLGALGPREGAFRGQLRQDPRVQSFSCSGYLPAGPSYGNNFFLYGDNQDKEMVKTLRYDVDEQYIPTLGIQMAGGRNFSEAYPTDSSAIIVNESAARAFGWGNNPIGHTLTTNLRSAADRKSYRVIGMVRDFHFKSLHERISPLVMVLSHETGPAILKVKTAEISGLLASLKAGWRGYTDEPFDYSFLDERVHKTYRAEQSFGLILGIFTALTIFVACLGLLGLAIFAAEQRTKEIGIRKVLGASVAGIVGLLSRDFIKPVLVALVLASPLAYYVMEKWLQNFAYRVAISPWVFVFSGLAAIGVALLTVSFQSVRAALASPADSLRSE